MNVPISPTTGKPMGVVYESGSETYRSEMYNFTYISFLDYANIEKVLADSLRNVFRIQMM